MEQAIQRTKERRPGLLADLKASPHDNTKTKKNKQQ